MVTETDEQPATEEPEVVAKLAPLLRARKDPGPDDIDHLEELIGSAVRRFKAERANSATRSVERRVCCGGRLLHDRATEQVVGSTASPTLAVSRTPQGKANTVITAFPVLP
jgi:hypothetical protein